MPELAEVDYYRKQWNPGLNAKITRVHLHPEKRVFRGADAAAVAEALAGRILRRSEARGKQMVFCFSGSCWLGVHLGMTGKLSTAGPDYQPGKHDHLVLFQNRRALVFEDMRQFGRIQFARSELPPPWWSKVPPDPASAGFTRGLMEAFLARHGKLPLKQALLLQDGFPGIGNWMADEILWRAGIAPRRRAAALEPGEFDRLYKETRFVSRQALAKIGKDFGDPPKTWLIHQRWSKKGVCPKHKVTLSREVVGGRTTAWCAQCQR